MSHNLCRSVVIGGLGDMEEPVLPRETSSPPHQINRRQSLRSCHVGAGLQHGPDRFLGLSLIVLARVISIGEGLADDVLKVGVHAAMRARVQVKEKPCRVFLLPARPLTESAAWPRA